MRAQDRMMEKKWGIFNHFLYNSEKGYPRNNDASESDILKMAEEWNEQVDSFDVEKLAKPCTKSVAVII